VSKGAFQPKQKGKQGAKSGKKPITEYARKGKCVMTDKDSGKKNKFPPYKICQRTNHLEKNWWFKGKPQIEWVFCKKLGRERKITESN